MYLEHNAARRLQGFGLLSMGEVYSKDSNALSDQSRLLYISMDCHHVGYARTSDENIYFGQNVGNVFR